MATASLHQPAPTPIVWSCCLCVASGVTVKPANTTSGLCPLCLELTYLTYRLGIWRRLAPGDEGAGLSRLASGGSVSTPLAARSEVRA